MPGFGVHQCVILGDQKNDPLFLEMLENTGFTRFLWMLDPKVLVTWDKLD